VTAPIPRAPHPWEFSCPTCGAPVGSACLHPNLAFCHERLDCVAAWKALQLPSVWKRIRVVLPGTEHVFIDTRGNFWAKQT